MKTRPLILWTSVVVAAFASPMLASKAINAMSEYEWESLREEAKKANVPLDVKSALIGYQPRPDSDNAAAGVKVVLRKLLKPPRPGSYSEFQGGLLDEFRDALKVIETENRKGPAADLSKIKRAVDVFEPTLSDFQRALEKPHWNFNRRWEQGAAMLMPDPAILKSLSKVLAAKALAHWQDSPEESARAISSIIRLANHLQTEPSQICILVAMACRNLAYKTVMQLAQKSPAAKGLLLRSIEEPIQPVDWRRLWHVDNVVTLDSLDLVTSLKGFHDLGLKPEDGVMRSRRTMLQTRAKIARLMIDAEAALGKDPIDFAAMRKVANQYYMPIQEILWSYHDVFAKLALGENFYLDTIDTLDANESLRRQTWLALKAIGAQGAPREANLPQWADPFTGKPFIFKKTGAGFVIYGVGTNRTDEGGRGDDGPDERPLDIVVKLSK